MNRPKILFIAPNSYPPTNPEANVNAKLIGLLSERGCEIDLICAETRRLYSPQSNDADLFFKKVKSIHTIKWNRQFHFSKITTCVKAICKLGIIYLSREIDWVYRTISVCESLMKNVEYDYIYTYDSCSEYVGLYFAKKYNIKWVSTWNDPYPWLRYPEPYGKGPHSKLGYIKECLLKNISKNVFRAVFPSSRLRDYMLQYLKIDKRCCLISPHLISSRLTIPDQVSNPDTLKFIHAGALSKERDPTSLFQGIELVMQENPTAKIEFTFLGVFDDLIEQYKQQVESLKIAPVIRFLPPVSYSACLKIINEYNICMVIEADLEEGIFLPSKVSDYLQNHKPILAISPINGCLHDDYLAGIIDYFANVKSAREIASEINKIYLDFKQKSLGKDNKNLLRYSEDTIYEAHLNQIFL